MSCVERRKKRKEQARNKRKRKRTLKPSHFTGSASKAPNPNLSHLKISLDLHALLPFLLEETKREFNRVGLMDCGSGSGDGHQVKGVLTHGGRYVQYNIYGNLFEVTTKYVPPIRPVGRGASGIVW